MSLSNTASSVPEMVILLFVTGFGLAIGSFLNVVIYRLPRRESLAFPASHCPACQTPIRPKDNIPLFGYLFLLGRCRTCRAEIALRYPAVELLTGFLFAAMYMIDGMSIYFISNIILSCILITVFCIDLEHMIIPDRITFPGALIGMVLAATFGWSGIVRALGGAVAGVMILVGMSLLGWLLYRRESVGFGDFKLVAVTGLYLGTLGNVIAIMLAILAGGIWGVLRIASGKHVAGEEVPFGTFIAVGCLLTILFRTEMYEWISQLIF